MRHVNSYSPALTPLNANSPFALVTADPVSNAAIQTETVALRRDRRTPDRSEPGPGARLTRRPLTICVGLRRSVTGGRGSPRTSRSANPVELRAAEGRCARSRYFPGGSALVSNLPSGETFTTVENCVGPR